MGNTKAKPKYKELTPDELKLYTQITNMKEKEIRQWHIGFYKDCSGDTMDKKTFLSIFKRFYVSDDRRADHFCNYVFGLFGNDQDGKIHFKEFLQIIDFPNQGTLDERLKLAFHMYNTSGDDGIDEKELSQLLKAMYGLAGEDNPQGDKDPNKRAQAIMKKFGANKDKKLTIEEFIIACKEDNYLMKRLAPYEEQTPSKKKESSSSSSRNTQA